MTEDYNEKLGGIHKFITNPEEVNQMINEGIQLGKGETLIVYGCGHYIIKQADGEYYVPITNEEYYTRGTPDLLYLIDGVFVAIEVFDDIAKAEECLWENRVKLKK